MTRSAPARPGRKSAYIASRRKVCLRPVCRMCCSVAQWSRAKVNVESAAALRNDRYTTRSTPAAAAASTTPVCSRTRSASSLAETKNSVCTPARARRIASPSAYSALARSAPRSGARLGSRRTKRRSAPCVVSDRATRPPIAPVAPVTAISVMPVATTCGRRLFRSGDWLAQQVTEALQDRKPDVLELDVAGGMRLLDVEAHDGAVISRAHLPGEVRARPAAVLDRDRQPVRRVGVQDL